MPPSYVFCCSPGLLLSALLNGTSHLYMLWGLYTPVFLLTSPVLCRAIRLVI
nr:MAG TPA: hypothetical protein [Caudoviricetes sp.]